MTMLSMHAPYISAGCAGGVRRHTHAAGRHGRRAQGRRHHGVRHRPRRTGREPRNGTATAAGMPSRKLTAQHTGTCARIHWTLLPARPPPAPIDLSSQGPRVQTKLAVVHAGCTPACRCWRRASSHSRVCMHACVCGDGPTGNRLFSAALPRTPHTAHPLLNKHNCS